MKRNLIYILAQVSLFAQPDQKVARFSIPVVDLIYHPVVARIVSKETIEVIGQAVLKPVSFRYVLVNNQVLNPST